MSGLLQDLRYALRQLRKNAGFTAVAVITLALGIGANTAIFTVVNALLLKMLPVKDPQRLVAVGDPNDVNGDSSGTPQTDIFSYPLYKELRDRNSVFSGLCAAASDHHIEVDTGEEQSANEKVTGRMASGNYFSVLGIEPAIGRLFSSSDDTDENANPVVVLGYDYWQRKFAGSPAVVGKNIRLNGFPFTVIGVGAPGFEGDVVGERMALFVPLSMQPEIIRGRHWRNSPHDSWLLLIGRLKPGISPVQAKANLNLVFQQALRGGYGATLTADDRRAIANGHITVSPGGGGLSELRGDYRTSLLLLMGIVGLVLLIACVNVANLLFARASRRNREIAIRLAIGANRGRLLRQLLSESILLALLGGVAGSLLAVSGVRLLVGMFGSGTVLPLAPDWRVFAFTTGVSLTTGILFGLFPALQTLRVHVSPALKDGARTTDERNSRFGLGKGLIAGQIALSLLVLFSASLLLRSLQNLMKQDFGYDRSRLVIARVDAVSAGYVGEKMKSLAEELVARLRNTPGVRAATYSKNGLFAGSESAEEIIVPGFNTDNARDRVSREDFVGPDYFRVVGMPIVAGRGIEVQDTETSARVAVVNEAMVKYFFAGKNPVGRQFTIDDPDWLDKPITVVGVSHDAKTNHLREQVKPRFYLPFQQVPDPYMIVLAAQVGGSPAGAVSNVLGQIKATAPSLPISFVDTLDQLVNDSAATPAAVAKLSGFLAGLALLLACVGLYGVMSYNIAGRTREVGVRMALGAQRSDVMGMVVREAMLLVIAGVFLGVPLALLGSRVLTSFLFGLKSTDPLSLIMVLVLLTLVAAFAGFIPARRAAKVDPMVALRYE